jgi:hypothetical protein
MTEKLASHLAETGWQVSKRHREVDQRRGVQLGATTRDAGPRGSKGQTEVIGIVIVAHGGLAAELKRATEHVVGPQAAMVAISDRPRG